MEATLVQAVRGEVTCVDAAGAWLAAGGGDRAVRLWRWRPGAGWVPAATARQAHRHGVTAMRWAPAGALLASGGVDGAARLWGGRSLAARRRLVAPGAAAVRALCWAGGGGARLLAGHDDGAVVLWAPARGLMLTTVRAHEGSLHALATLAGERLLLTACTDGVLKLFHLTEVCAEEGAVPAPLQWVDGAHDLGVLCAAAGEAGAAAATGGHDARIRVWRVRGATLADGGALEGHTAAVTALRWARGVLASASLDRTARVWEPPCAAAAGRCLLVVRAHTRYLTCLALADDLRYMVTCSNDKSFRTWSLGAWSLSDELEPACERAQHFALGDLQGIDPVECEEEEEAMGGAESGDECGDDGCGASRVWAAAAHGAAINCLACCGDLLATASSDGVVKLWTVAGGTARELHALEAHRYPALAAEFGAGGGVLLTAGMDGCARLWDVASGVPLRALSVPGGGGGEAGGGGVRGARLSSHRPPLALLATDDGLAPLWLLADAAPRPALVYAVSSDAVSCCAWSADGALAAVGTTAGELRLLAPPNPDHLYHDSQAHDLGVLSCDFAPRSSSVHLAAGGQLLATVGADSLLKLWVVVYQEGAARVRLARAVAAHGGAACSVRWAPGSSEALAVTAGEDGWARVWRVELAGAGGGAARVAVGGAVPVGGAGGALCAAAAGGGLLAVGSLAGELALWRLRPDAAAAEGDSAPAPLWTEADVQRWLTEYVLHGCAVSAARAAALAARARRARLAGARLLAADEAALLADLALEESEETAGDEEVAAVRASLLRERRWLRRAPPAAAVEARAPHGLRCPLSHRLLREPARAADGYSYERANLREWLLAAPLEAARSPVSGRRLRSTLVAPNYALRDALRAFLHATEGDETGGTEPEHLADLSEVKQPADPTNPPEVDEPPDPTNPSEVDVPADPANPPEAGEAADQSEADGPMDPPEAPDLIDLTTAS